MSLLKSIEAKILACVQNRLWARFVTLPDRNHIWTLTVTDRNLPEAVCRKPLVLVHGFGGGVALWVRNLDSLSRHRPVIAFDLLGFGRSSRPRFPLEPAEAEQLFVVSMERWRKEVGVENMILLGHSLGGFLATAYTIQHPKRVSCLILVEPWGFLERPQPAVDHRKPKRSLWVKGIFNLVTLFNPLAFIRAAGPWGPGLVSTFRPDFRRKFEDLFDDDTVTQYIYHCNAQRPSGEVGFRVMSKSLGWAKRPMLHRVHLLPAELPVTFVYGSHSWMDKSTGQKVALERPQSYTHTLVIDGAAHHVYADQPEEFNQIVQNICDSVD